MRGKPQVFCDAGAGWRQTPAHAGQAPGLLGPHGRGIPARAGRPFVNLMLEYRYKADPRPCGATIDSLASIYDVGGRSPPTRGNPEHSPRSDRPAWQIPAHAGQPLWVDILYFLHSVDGAGFFHPREPCSLLFFLASAGGAVFSVSLDSGFFCPPCAGGAGLVRLPAVRQVEGRPPRWRGGLGFHRLEKGALGQIPVHAGRSRRSISIRTPQRAEPRPCGAVMGPDWQPWSRRGGPPPLRGLLHFKVVTVVVAGLTPACGGVSGETSRSAKR